MRIIYFGNNRLGVQVLKWLKEQGEEIAGLIVHKEGKYREELMRVSGLPGSKIFSTSSINSDLMIENIKKLKPDIGVSVLYGYIINEHLLSLFRNGCINLHLSYLPYNRGAFPNVWSIIEGTPAGVSLHYIDTGIDTGDIISQKEVPIDPIDTGKSLYEKLEKAGIELFIDTWPSIKKKNNNHFSQSKLNNGSYHELKDVEKIDRIDLNQDYKAKDLINILRARTFPPYKGAFFVDKGKKVYLKLEMFYDNN